MIIVIVENIGKTQLTLEKFSAVSPTKAGVIACPIIVPSNGENDKATVTKICCAPANQF